MGTITGPFGNVPQLMSKLVLLKATPSDGVQPNR